MTLQDKSITKTIIILVVIILTILVLFFNKITTPRYLSDIELRINGLILVDKNSRDHFYNADAKKTWRLVARNDAEKEILNACYNGLKSSLRKQVEIIEGSSLSFPDNENTIPILKPSGEYIAYFNPPYNKDKMIVTLSSVMTHR